MAQGLPHDFLSRIRLHLQDTLQNTSGSGSSTAGDSAAVEALFLPASPIVSSPPPDRDSVDSVLNPRTPTVYTLLAERIATHYDRIAKGDILRNVRDAASPFVQHSVRRLANGETTAEAVETAAGDESAVSGAGTTELCQADFDAMFESRFGLGAATFTRVVDDIVRHIADDYAAYFEAESQITAFAGEYDAVHQWLARTQAVFGESAESEQEHLEALVTRHMNRTAMDATFARYRDLWRAVRFDMKVLDQVKRLVGAPLTCKICFSGEMECALIPCGHTLCRACAARVTQCPFCTTTFYSTQALFFP
jgi:hypothetical protein